MITFTHLYHNREEFSAFLQKHGINEKTELVIQLIYENDYDFLTELKEELPFAKIFEVCEHKEFLTEGKALLLLTILGEEDCLILDGLAYTSGGNFDYRNIFAHYHALFNHNPNITFTLDVKGEITHINDPGKRYLGNSENIIGRLGMDFVRREDRRKSQAHFLRALEGKPQQLMLDISDNKGNWDPFQMTYIPISLDGKVIAIHVVGINFSAQKKAEHRITRLEHHDPLTGLANRVLFEKSLSVLCQYTQRNNERLAVIFLDIDRFKRINDSAGHTVGDEILKLVVERVQVQLSETQLLARFTGDKFSILVPHIKSKRTLERLIKRIKNAFVEPFVYNESEYFLSVSMGISIYPDHGHDLEDILKNADIALYASRVQGDDSYLYYSSEMNKSFDEKFEFESYLRKALSKNEFVLHYQPQICIESGKIIGCEALIRWKHPKLGIVSPANFIPLAEEIGLIEDMGLWVLQTACKKIHMWKEEGITPFPISINVSAKQFLKIDFVDRIREIILKEQIDPKFIHIEITESTTLRDIQYSIGLVNELKEFGVSVSLDDFGTGYSALSYLKDFSIDILKIDRAFIKNLQDENQDSAIVKAIIMMCNGLSLKTIAEGVETEEQLKLLKAFGCDAVQGFFYSKPLPDKEFEAYIKGLKSPA